MTTLFNYWENLVYLALIAGLVGVEHRLLYERLRRYELVRRAIGIATVMLPAGVLALESSGWSLWLTLCAGFLVAAAVKVGLTIRDHDREQPLKTAQTSIQEISNDLKTQTH